MCSGELVKKERLKKIVVQPNRPRIAVKGQEISICGQEQNSQEAIVKKSQFVVKNKTVKKLLSRNLNLWSRTKKLRRCILTRIFTRGQEQNNQEDVQLRWIYVHGMCKVNDEDYFDY
jgi:hypothetical protein